MKKYTNDPGTRNCLILTLTPSILETFYTGEQVKQWLNQGHTASYLPDWDRSPSYLTSSTGTDDSHVFWTEKNRPPSKAHTDRPSRRKFQGSRRCCWQPVWSVSYRAGLLHTVTSDFVRWFCLHLKPKLFHFGADCSHNAKTVTIQAGSIFAGVLIGILWSHKNEYTQMLA